MGRNVTGTRSTPNKTEKYRINEEITAREVRLVGVDGEQLGIVAIDNALQTAEDEGVDLVEVAPGAEPPVCRLLDYGKLKYKEQKKAAEARKRSASQTVKELRIRYSTDKHDLETKVRNARKFIEAGDRVRFQMRFRGREVVYEDLGKQIFERVAQQLEDIASVEEVTPLAGRRMMLTLVPRSAAAVATAQAKAS